jgi:hypothetical protein
VLLRLPLLSLEHWLHSTLIETVRRDLTASYIACKVDRLEYTSSLE